MITAQESKRGSRTIRRPFFWICRLKEKAHFEGCLVSGLEDVWVPSDPGPEHVPDDPPFGALQFTSDEVESVLQDLDVNKGSGPGLCTLLCR
jgi:hypothetical protein